MNGGLYYSIPINLLAVLSSTKHNGDVFLIMIFVIFNKIDY